MEDETRIIGKKRDINTGKVHDFFERRGDQFNPQHPLTSILYQDHDPLLAARRDRYEKNKILPQLGPAPFHSILDIGCGIGRWADVLTSQGDFYVGVDFSATLIKIARNRHPDAKTSFHILAAQDISPAILPDDQGFDLVVISGVLIYMNDQQVETCLTALVGLMAAEYVIYIREPLGIDQRLTLDGSWSRELDASYRAIYRTSGEMNAIIDRTIGNSGNKTTRFEPLYDEDDLNNRRETRQFYTILKSGD